MDELSRESQLVAAFIEKRLIDNLAVFQKEVPDVYNAFNSYQEQRFFLIYGTDGGVNLFDRDKGDVLYDDNPVQSLYDELDRYRSHPICRPFFVSGGDPDYEFVIPVHYKAMEGLGGIQKKALINLAVDSYSSIVNKDVGESGVGATVSLVAGSLQKTINSFFVFSMGMGFDIERLYEQHDIKRLYIVENNLDSFYASMQLIDWAAIINKSKEKGFNIYFLIADDVDELLTDVVELIGKDGRHNVGGAYMYSSFYWGAGDELFKKFKDKLDLSVLAGFGFYDDSRMSLAHSVANVKNGVPCIKSDKSINKRFGQEYAPVFVIGSGPSLDSDIEYIKKHSEKVIIFSCGSALKSLYINGIKPDFHVELERTAHVLHWIKSSSEEEAFTEYLKDICFVGLSQVHPGVFELFDRAGQIPKDTETGSLVMRRVLGEKGVPVVSRTPPTCVHAGFTAAVLFGFRNIHFFGVDMGYKSFENHHAGSSLYSELSDDMAKRLIPSNAREFEVESNFEGEVIYTSGFFPMFRANLERVIEAWQLTFDGLLNVYNCSDGAKIEGAEAKRASELDFSYITSLDKKGLVDSIYESHFAFVPKEEDALDIVGFVEGSFDKVDRMTSWLKNELNDVDSVLDGLKVVDKIAYDFHSKLDELQLDESDSWIYSLFDGTFLYALGAMQSTLCLPMSEEKCVVYFNECLVVIRELMDDIASDFRNNVFELDKEEYYSFFKGV